MQSVWASKYNERAYVSTRKVGLNFDDVRMAVLTQVRAALMVSGLRARGPGSADTALPEGDLQMSFWPGEPGSALAWIVVASMERRGRLCGGSGQGS